MRDLLLEHAELLALLGAVQARAMISIAPDHLFPVNADDRDAILRQGTTSLIQRGLLEYDASHKSILNAHLVPIITTAAYPDIAVVIIHNDHQTGLRFFWFYLSGDHIVEHIVTKERLHQLSLLADVSTMINRMENILSINEPSSLEIKMEMAESTFFIVKNLVKQQEHEHAKDVLRSCGIVDQKADLLLSVLEHPSSVSNIALLRCDHQTVIDGRNILLMQDQQSAWSAKQSEPGVPELVVETTAASTIKEQLLCYFEELSKV